MSIDPQCNFCPCVDKFRCKSIEEASKCEAYIQNQELMKSVRNVTKPKPKVKNTMSKATEQLAELSTRTSRSMIAVIDAMAARGAYKGEELATIGQLRSDAAQVVQLAEAVQSDAAAQTEEAGKPETPKKK